MTAAVEFTIPSPAAAGFTVGEKAIGPASTAVAAGTRHFAKRFNLSGGTYTVKLWAQDVSTLWVGAEAASVHRIGVHNQSNAPSTFDFFVQDGTHRIDVTLVNLTTKVSGFALSLWKNGTLIYASGSAGWVWSASPVTDADIPSAGDARLSYPVWTLTPNWANGITERLEFLTEVFASETDNEQRRSLRIYPRRSIEASFLRNGVARQRIDNFIVGVGFRKILVPLWFEQLKIPAALSGTVITWPADTLTLREFAAGDLALLVGADPDVYDVVSVATVTDSTITLSAAPTRTWPAGTRITPLRVARFEQLPQTRMVTDRLGSAQVRFNLDEPETNIVPSWGYCAPLWRFKVDRSDTLQIDPTRTTYMIDVDTGKVDITDPGGKARVGMKASIKLFGREQLFAFRSFITQARGRAVRFWWPTGTHDVEPVGTIGGITLDVKSAGYSDWMSQPQDARLMLGIVFGDGRPTVYRRIQSVQSFDGYDRFTLTQAMPAVARSDIERVMFVMPVRFDQDGFELQHVSDEAKAVLGAVVVRSSDIAGMPDIDCWVTSWPYPAFETDSLEVSATVTGGAFGGIPVQIEGLDLSAIVTGGSFPTTVLYTTQVMTPEALDMSASVTGGDFPVTVGYETYDAGAEGMDISASVTGGALVVALISTPMDPEALQMSATVTGGTLS